MMFSNDGDAGHGSGRPAAGLRRLCIGVDDLGMAPGIERAVAALVERGRVHAVGALVGGPDWLSAAVQARRWSGQGVAVGLHLDLTAWPLGRFKAMPLRRLIAASWSHRLDAGALRATMTDQLAAFEDAQGMAPAFVDGHEHVHQFPQVREALVAVLLERYPRQRPWLRSTCAPRPGPAALASVALARSQLKARVIEALGAHALVQAAARNGMTGNGRLLGVHDFRGGAARYHALLLHWLAWARDGDLLMTHPSERADGVVAGMSRQAEFEVLGAPELDQVLTRLDIALGRIR